MNQASLPSYWLDGGQAIQQAWQEADQAGAAAQTPTERGRSIALQCRYALIAASHTAFATKLLPMLLAMLVRRSLIPLELAIVITRQSVYNDNRAVSLAFLAAEAPERFQAQLYQEAIAAALIEDAAHMRGFNPDSVHERRARVLAALAEYIPLRFRSPLIEEALVHINAIQGNDYWKAEALELLIPHTPVSLYTALTDMVGTIAEPFHQRLAIEALAPFLMPVVPDLLLGTAQSIPDLGERAQALIALLRYASEERKRPLVQAIMDTTHAAGFPWWLVRPLARCVLYAPEPERARLRSLALEMLPGLPHSGGPQLPAVVDTAAFLEHMAKRQDLSSDELVARHEALEQNGIIQNQSIDVLERIGARIDLVAILSGEQQLRIASEALAMIMRVRQPYWQAEFLAWLAPHIPEAIMPAALSFACTLPAAECAKILLAFLPRLSSAERAITIDEIAGLVEATESISERAALFAKLVTIIPESSREAIVVQALAAARAYPGYGVGANYLLDVLPYLPPAQQTEVWHEALNEALELEEEWRSTPLVKICAHIPDRLLPEALQAVGACYSTYLRSEVFVTMAPRLSNELLQQAVRMTDINNDWDPLPQLMVSIGQALAQLGENEAALELIAPYEGTVWAETVLSEIWPVLPIHSHSIPAHTMSDRDTAEDQFYRIISLLRTRPAEQSETLLPEAIALLSKVPRNQQGRAFITVVPLLSVPLLHNALAQIVRIEMLPWRDEELELLMPALVRADLVEEAITILKRAESARGYIALARLLPEQDREGLLEKAYLAAQEERNLELRAEWLALVALALPGSRRSAILAEAIDAAQALDPNSRSQALASIAVKLPEVERAPVIDAAIEALSLMTRWNNHILKYLSPYLNPIQVATVLQLAEAFPAEDRLEARAILVDWLSESELVEMLNNTLTIMSKNWITARDNLQYLAAKLSAYEPAALYPYWVKILHGLAVLPQTDFLRGLEPVIPLVSILGGVTALKSLAKAILDPDISIANLLEMSS